MSNFRLRLRNATKILATGEGAVKSRLKSAIIDELLIANVPDDPSIPQYFRDKQGKLLRELKTRSRGPKGEDRVQATIEPMRFKTAAGYADRVWQLYNEFEEYQHSGFIPSVEPRP